ncbi:MAG: hypothetical protein ACFFA6_17520 [Promethearchaeota archaeon]
MGLWDAILLVCSTLFPLLLTALAVADWWRTKRKLYLLMPVLYLIAELGFATAFFNADLMMCASSIVWLAVGLFLHLTIRRSNRAPGKPSGEGQPKPNK